MKNEKYEKIKGVCFWGCGHIGRRMLSLWERYGKHPEYFCDNNSELWEKCIDDIRIISPMEMKATKPRKVIVVAGQAREIQNQLEEMGISDERILVPGYFLETPTLYALSEYLFASCLTGCEERTQMPTCLLDLSCGMVLGGVEQWSYQTAKLLREMGYAGYYLMPQHVPQDFADSAFPVLLAGDNNEEDRIQNFNSVVEKVAGIENPVAVCNFPFDFFQAACVLKRCTKKKIRIVAVVHNDESIYYDVYGVWKNEIDVCFAVSSKIYRRLVEYGFPEEKIRPLPWNMAFPVLSRSYSAEGEKIRIGYAGRISIEQKRADLLASLARTLKRRNIDFLLEIAGTGDYEEELRGCIEKEGLDDKVQMIGALPHESMFDFWGRQDVYVSCSEYEGHSISQTEAMAMGAVPIATKTSGTEDDIEDGWNGCIVAVGDIEGMAGMVETLYQDRGKMREMGKNAAESIREKSDSEEERRLWEGVLRNAEPSRTEII